MIESTHEVEMLYDKVRLPSGRIRYRARCNYWDRNVIQHGVFVVVSRPGLVSYRRVPAAPPESLDWLTARVEQRRDAMAQALLDQSKVPNNSAMAMINAALAVLEAP